MPGAVRGVLLVAVLQAWPAAARAQTLDEALRLYADARLDRALSAFETLLSSGGDDAQTLATICLHLGVLRSGAGDLVHAREAFQELLAIRPDASLPDGLGPTVEQAFHDARQAAGPAPLAPVLELGPRRVRVGAIGTEARLVARTVLEVRVGPGQEQSHRSLEREGPGPHIIAVPLEGATELHARVLDAHGWLLASATAPVPRLAVPASSAIMASGADPSSAHSAPLVTRWWLWAGIGAAVAGGVAIVLIAGGSSADGATVGAPSLVGGR